MKTRPLILAAALALPLAAAQMDHSTMPGMTAPMGARHMAILEKATGAAFDTSYMSMMIEHHRGAVDMARMEVKNGKRGDVKAAAQKIVDDQQREINELTGYLRRFYGSAPARYSMDLMKADMRPMMESAAKAMTPMAGMATNTDRAFLEHMIPHHQSAIDMSELALERADRAEVKRFARKVIDAQAKEIKQFRAWLEAGY